MRVPRAALAVERYLRGEDLTVIRRELAVSRLQWSQRWRGFQDAAAGAGEEPETVSMRKLLSGPADFSVAGSLAPVP